MSAQERIENDIKSNKIFLYMKGTPSAPQCGFSAQAVSILQSYETPFGSLNVLEDDEIRQGIKDFSDWPTIPQLYINGEFVGGCDIMIELHGNGELAKIIEAAK